MARKKKYISGSVPLSVRIRPTGTPHRCFHRNDSFIDVPKIESRDLLRIYFSEFVDGFLSGLKGGTWDSHARGWSTNVHRSRTLIDDLYVVGDDMRTAISHFEDTEGRLIHDAQRRETRPRTERQRVAG